MRSTIVALGILLSSSAFAFNTTHTEHDFQTLLGEITLDNACVTDTEVRSINPVRVCDELVPQTVDAGEGMVFTDWNCARYSTRIATVSRTYQYQACTDYRVDDQHVECVNFETRTGFIPSTIEVRTVDNHGETSTWPGKASSVTLPACN